MEENTIVFVMGITVVNLLIVLICMFLVIYTYRKCFILQIPQKDHSFYALKLQKCVAFLIFNIIALYVNYRTFNTPLFNWPRDLVFLRYCDRSSVLVYSLYKMLDVLRYYPTAYDSKHPPKSLIN